MNRRCAILILLLLGAMCSRLPAPMYQSGYSDAAARALATNYSASLGRLALNDGVYDYSVSGVFLNSRWYLTSAHALINPFGNGDASISGITQGSTPGGPLISVTSQFIHPAYDGTGNHPDAALLYIPDGANAPTLTISSVVGSGYYDSTVVTSVGFGWWGAWDGVLSPTDGYARGWRAWVESISAWDFPLPYYQMEGYAPYPDFWLNGRGLNGDSGSPVFDGNGHLVGINIAGGGGLSAYGSTSFLRLIHPEVLEWIQSIITPVEPQIVSLAPEGFDLRLTWQGKGGSNYVVQAASALGGTNTFTDLSAPMALPGVGPVLTNFLDVGVMTNHTTRFYRLRLQ